MGIARRLCEIDRRQALHLARAPWYLLRAYGEFRLRPVKAILDELQAPLPIGCAQGAGVSPPLVGWAIGVAARRVPWRSDCLVQALAAARWLRRHGYAPDLHLGVAQSQARGFEAHAWLTLDGAVIVGDLPGGLDAFVPILGVSQQEAESARWR